MPSPEHNQFAHIDVEKMPAFDKHMVNNTLEK